jgi:hypothetical protein
LRAFALLLLLGAVGYGVAASAAKEHRSESVPPAALERLEALGYEPWVAEKRPPRHTGVVLHDPARAAGGYVLFASRGSCVAELIDREGAVLHRWSGPVQGFWSDTELLRDGSLLVVGADSEDRSEQQNTRFLRRLAWDSTPVWEAGFPAHHDVEVLADGQILTLSSSVRTVDDAGTPRTIVDDEIVLVGEDGEVREKHSLYDTFAATPGASVYGMDRRGVDIGGTTAVDVFHANSVEWIDLPALAGSHPVYAAGNVLISMRHQNALAVVDRTGGGLTWIWGSGILDGQHSARMLDNGNILVFDNGLRRKRSRVLEVDPRREASDAVVWEFDGASIERFFTTGGGASQRLPNGNTLVTVTGQGRLFEATAAGDLVWAFANPTRDKHTSRRATIHASKWLPEEFVLPIVARKG